MATVLALRVVFEVLRDLFCGRAALQLEVFALRHQLTVLQTIREASQTDYVRPIVMGRTLLCMAGLAIGAGNRLSSNFDRVAPKRISFVLGLEVAPRPM